MMPSPRRPRRHQDWMVNQLPVAMTDDEFFTGFVTIFQTVGDTLFAHPDNVEHVADPRLAPAGLLPYLASWIGLEMDPSATESTQRRVLNGATRSLAWRGTRHGLTEYLALVSGARVVVEDGGGCYARGQAPDDPAWVRIELHSIQDTEPVDLAVAVAAVRDEVPAHVRAWMYVDGRLAWSSAPDSPTPRGALPQVRTSDGPSPLLEKTS